MLISAAWAVGVLLTVLLTVIVLTYMERKVIGHIQARLGPMRHGWHGTLQAPADTLKLLLKEDYIPASVEKGPFKLAPYLIFIPYFMIFAAIPIYSAWTPAALRLGLFYIMAISGISVLGSLLAGWASNNKYALLGGMRAVAQVISYELPLVISVLTIVMLTGSLDLQEIVKYQVRWPLFLIQPVGLFIFITASMAEMTRSPFDIPHAEGEIIAGPFIEYSGLRFGFFQLGEYADMFAVALMTSLIFFAGWHLPFGLTGPAWLGVLWLVAKAYLVITFFMWVRGTYPRFRPDQLMAFAWKYMLPLSLVNLGLTAVFIVLAWPLWLLPIVVLAAAAGLTAWLGRKRFALYASRA